MAVVERFELADLEGLRVGRFTSRLNTTCTLYRLGDTVLDTGPSNQWRHVRRFLQERHIRRVLVTHHHEDHSGNLASIKKRWKPEALAPATSRTALAQGFELQIYRRVVWGRAARVETQPLPEVMALEGGVQLRPIHTPGHSFDSTCFLEPERGWLFSGDLFIATRTRYLRRDEDISGYILSLRRVLREDFQTVLCSHRGVLEKGREALQRKLDFLVSLCREAHELQTAGRTLAEITSALVGAEDRMAWITGGHFSKHNLIASCLQAADRGVV